MSAMKLERKIIKLQEWEALAEDAKSEALKAEIKAEMLKEETKEMKAGRFIICCTSVLSNRFDTAGFNTDMYQQNTKQTISRHFSIS